MKAPGGLGCPRSGEGGGQTGIREERKGGVLGQEGGGPASRGPQLTEGSVRLHVRSLPWQS